MARSEGSEATNQPRETSGKQRRAAFISGDVVTQCRGERRETTDGRKTTSHSDMLPPAQVLIKRRNVFTQRRASTTFMSIYSYIVLIRSTNTCEQREMRGCKRLEIKKR